MAGPGHFAACVLIAAGALLAGALVGRRLAADRRRCVWVLGPCVLALVLYALCRWLPAWEVRIFPWAFYAFWQKQWVYAPGIFVLACGGAMLPIRWNRFVVWAAAAALLAFSAWTGRWMLRDLCPGSTDRPVRGLVVEQSTGYTCAPAACATLLACWGIAKSEHEMAQLCLCVPEKGTAQFDTYRGLALAAGTSGLKPRIVYAGPKRLGQLVRPFIIGTGAHAIVVFEVRGDELLVGDPFVRRPVWRQADVTVGKEVWDGVAVLLCREGPFDGRNAPHIDAWLGAAPESAPRRRSPAK